MNDVGLFTGERYIPGITDDKLEVEHYQRYYSVRKIVAGKVVLDAACGEGYGSNVLASVAKQVTGIDIDEDTVQRANEKYGKAANLTYLQGSIEKLPLKDDSVDVVVSFETIEHVPEALQIKFLDEVTRVLKKDGLLIMSTPNKRIYSDLHNYKNEYHVKEFYHDEFVTFLKGKFQYVKMYNQAFQVASLITACEGEGGQIDFYNKDAAYNQEGKYYIAIASNQEINVQKMSSVYMNLTGEYENLMKRIIELQNEEEVRNKHIAKLDREADVAGRVISTLQTDMEERNNHINRLDGEISTRDARILELLKEVEEKNNQIEGCSAEIQQKNTRIVELQNEEEEKNSHIKRLDEAIVEKNTRIQELQEEVEEKNAQISSCNAEIHQKNTRIVELQNEEEEKNSHIKRQDEMIVEKDTRIQELQEEVEEKNAQISSCNTEIQLNNARIVELQSGEEERNNHIHKLDMDIEEKNVQIRELEEQMNSKDNKIQELEASVDEEKKENEVLKEDIVRLSLNETLVEILKNDIQWKNESIAKYQDEIRGYIARIQELEQAVRECERLQNEILAEKDNEQRLCDELADSRSREQQLQEALQAIELAKNQMIAELEQTIRNKEGHIELLLEVERAYERDKQQWQQLLQNKDGHIELLLEKEREFEREKSSRTYKLSKKMQKAVQTAFPAESRRRFAVRVTGDVVRHPIKMCKVINPLNVGTYAKLRKSQGMPAVREKYYQAKLKAFGIVSANADAENTKTIQDYEKFDLPTWKRPTVSIVIPVYNQFHYTYECLKSILQNSGDISYEVLIANDYSTDITKDIKKIVGNVKLITTKENVRFLLNCNNAAKHAKGKYILFLNNDTQVKENWLEPLVTLIESDQKIGMVGSKLVYPDGTLQEAGGIVWKDASAWNYGNRKDPADPEFNYVKEADYISGAAIMIRHSLWKELGGFDERFAPAYYEDTDLAFQVRAAGYKVMYQPLSVVVHFEGVSNGTDVSTGLKHYQQVNFEKFYEKWKAVLETEHEVNAENVFTAKDRSNHKKHILVVDHYVPHHDQDAGGKCTYMYLQTFVKMGFKVTFIGDNYFKHEPYTTQLNQMGIEVLYGNYYYLNWQEWLKENAHYFDYIYVQRPHIAIKYIDIVKEYSNAKIFYFAHDLHHIREYREYEMTGNQEKLESSENWKKVEYELFDKSDVGHVVGSFEQEVMQKAFPDKPIRNIPLYIYERILDDVNKNFKERNDLVYVGGFGHPPNVDAVLWFAKEIFPGILKKYPNMKWHVVGGKVPEEIQNLASDNIIIEGFVSDEVLEQLYRTCRVAVVPLRFGAGVKGKVVEANYFQIPLITTSIGAEGLSQEEQSMLVEDDADKFAELVCELYEDYDRLRKISNNAKQFIEKHFTLKEAERVLRMDIDI